MATALMLTTCKFHKVMLTGWRDHPDGENGTLRVPPSSSLQNSDFAQTFKPPFLLFPLFKFIFRPQRPNLSDHLATYSFVHPM